MARESDDNDNAKGDGSSSSSSDEEDLQSPAVIHQQRTNQTPAILNSANGVQVACVKPVDTCEFQLIICDGLALNSKHSILLAVFPWSTEISTVTIGNSVTVTPTVQTSSPEGDKGSNNSKDDEWADFSTASFGKLYSENGLHKVFP